MNKNLKRLLSNLGIFTIANFSTKVLSFLILPLYTAFLTTEEYGSIDLATTLIQLLFPVFTFAISDAIMRFGISEKSRVDQVFSIGIKQVTVGIIPMLIVSVIYAFVMHNTVLGAFVFILYAVESYNTLFANFAKAINKTKQMAIVSTSVSAIILGFNVLFVAVFKWGINGYFFSMIIGNTIGIAMYISLCQIKTYIAGFSLGVNWELKKQMLAYSIPLIPNAVFWWINSSLDRWTLTFISSVSVVGIYAVANKLPTIISTISTVFSQAWNLSLFQSDKSEQKLFFERTYSFYAEIMFCCAIGIIMLCKIFAKFAFSGDFFVAWKLVPILTVGVFFNSLNAILGSLFTANKDTKYIFVTTLMGSVINCILNIPFVILWGAYGAATATAVSYITVFAVRTYKVGRLYNIKNEVIKSLFKFLFLIGLSVLTIQDNAWAIVYIATILYCIGFALKTTISIYKKRRNKNLMR